jgi:hypothetical protein
MTLMEILSKVIDDLSQKAEHHYTETLFSVIGAAIVFQFRVLIFEPIKSGISFLVSAEYRDRWKISGKYSLYHEPIIVDHLARIRASNLILRMGIFRNTAEQADWKRSTTVCYKGTFQFSGQFIIVTMQGSVERYKGISKVIVLHRIYRPAKNAANSGTFGKMMGISNDNEIYSIPVIISRHTMKYSAVKKLMRILIEKKKGMQIRAEVRDLIDVAEICEQGFLSEDFNSPFS